MDDTPKDFSYLKDYHNISLTTFYRSGKAVSTPVDFILKEDKLYANTAANSYKVKRIRGNPKAIIAPCSFTGKIKGPSIEVIAKILPDGEDEAIKKEFDEKWNTFIFRLFRLIGKLAFWRSKVPEKRVILEITTNKVFDK